MAGKSRTEHATDRHGSQEDDRYRIGAGRDCAARAAVDHLLLGNHAFIAWASAVSSSTRRVSRQALRVLEIPHHGGRRSRSPEPAA